MMQSHSKATLFSLLLVLFLDGLGQGVIFPVLGDALLAVGHANLFVHHASLVQRNLIYGSSMTVFFLCWFFGAALLGDVSDRMGRKKALMITLMGMTAGNLVSALAFSMHSLILVYLGRVIVGFTAGSQAIAQAAIADVSAPEDQAKNTGLVLMGVTLGLVLGPAIGGVLSDSTLIPWFSYSTPLYCTAILALVNVLLLGCLFQETRSIEKGHKIRFGRALEIFAHALARPKVRRVVVVFFLLQMCWTIFYLELPIHMLTIFGGGTKTISIVMTIVGAGLAIGCAVLPKYVEPLFKEPITVTLLGYGIFTLGFVLVMISPDQTFKYILMFIASIFMALGYIFNIKVISQQASKDEQGWIMGVQNATMVLATGSATLWGGALMGFSQLTVFVIAISTLAVTLAWASLYKAVF